MRVDRARARYRRILRLAPARLRDRHGTEMEDAFADRWCRAQARGRVATAIVWIGAAADLLRARVRPRRPIYARLAGAPPERSSLMLGTELKYAFRSLRRQRFATALILTMLTLGVAATTVIFSVVNALFLKPFPFPDPDRLVYVNEKAPRWNLERTGVNYRDFMQWRQAGLVFEGMGLYDDIRLNLSDGDGAERVLGAAITCDFLTVLGVTPLRGRLFTADEDRPNGPRVALVSEAMWRDRFGGREDVLAKSLKLNGRDYQIVGVLPRHAEFPVTAKIWIPLAEDPNSQDQSYSYDAIARLKPGVTVEMAGQDLLRAHQPIFDTRDKEHVVSPFAMPLRETLVRDFRTIAGALFAAVALLLVVACANVAAVMLARAIARRREMGIRLAVGANRWRLLRQLFVENVLLAVGGGVLGLAVGRWALTLLVTASADILPGWATFTADARLIAFAVLLTAGTALLFGWAPAFHAIRGDLRSAMTAAAAASTTPPSGRRTLTWLVAAEFALAAVLLVGGGLLFRAFGQVRHVDPGFRVDHVLTFQVSLPAVAYADGPARLGFWNRVLDRLRGTAGVDAAGVITCPPLGCHWGNFYRIDGRPPLKAGEADPVVLSRIASAGYFEAMGLRLATGRFFTAKDGLPDTPRVVIVNETFVRTFWPAGTDPIGKRLSYNGDGAPWMTVVGVTKDVKHYGLERPMRPGLYFPAPQEAERTGGMTVAIRTSGDPDAFAATARAIVREVDPTLPVYRVQTMEQALADSMRSRATYSWMLGVFAALALVLALGGTYGVTSYLVTQRHREIGIRMAIGARAADIIREILRGSLAWVTAGVVVGLLGAIFVAGFLGDLLFGVSPRDPIVLASAAVALALAALVANWLPARRAARTSPMASLRV